MARLACAVVLVASGCARPAQTAERIVATPVVTPTPTPLPEATSAPVVGDALPHTYLGTMKAPGPSGAMCTTSWYAAGLVAPEDLTAASRDHKRGTHLRVSRAGRSVVVRVNDYGPAVWTGRCLDLSRGAFRALADPRLGLIDVHVEAA